MLLTGLFPVICADSAYNAGRILERNPNIRTGSDPIMAFLSTGPIENNPVNGVRPTQQVTVKIDNRSVDSASSVSIQGYYLNAGTRVLYVSEVVQIATNQVITKNYYADFNGFEFIFVTPANMTELSDFIQISVWGKSSTGQLVTAHRLVSEVLPCKYRH
jgi:hypothetical protein